MVSTLSIDSLPEEVRLLICSKVAAHSLTENRNLQLVSKTFQRLCNEQYVLRQVTLDDLHLYPWFRFPEFHKEFTIFVNRCFEAKNPGAIYRYGVVQFFHGSGNEHQLLEGLQRIASAADNGIGEAQFVYGSILICLGDESKKKGCQILSRVRMLIVDRYQNCWIQESWMRHFADLRYLAQPMVKRLKSNYVPKICNCEGSKKVVLQDPGYFRERFQRPEMLVNIFPSLSCDICLCHTAVQIFFDVMESL